MKLNNESKYFSDWSIKKLKKEYKGYIGQKIEPIHWFGIELELKKRGIQI